MYVFDELRAVHLRQELKATRPTITSLELAVGGLSKPSKMPWYGYSLPASACQVGSRLRRVPGSVCSQCYAHKGRYVFKNVQDAMQRRLLALSDLELWAANMVILLERKSNGELSWFRWHDSGDLQSRGHLLSIIWIARSLPHIKFWLPTKEYGLAQEIVDSKIFGTPNLTIRVSAPGIGQVLEHELLTSSVGAGSGHRCPASTQGGQCGDCRACWHRGVENVDYPLH